MDHTQPPDDWRRDDNNQSILQNISVNMTGLGPQNQPGGDQLKFDPVIIIYSGTFLVAFCTVSLIANIIILTSVCFMRLKVQPTLYISISLAAADTFSLFLLGLGLVLFTLLPALKLGIDAPCVMLFIEAMRMGSIMTTILHLVALAGNHYLGILLPLRYPYYMTGRNLKCTALVLWTLPSALLIINTFVLEKTDNCSPEFLMKAKFRTTFAIPFFTIMSLMLFIYCHIYILVKKHQTKPLRGKCPTGKKKLSFTRSQVNKKAIVTTLMIVGSMVCGWMPAFTYFVLCCKDCILKEYWLQKTITEHILLVAINFLMIAKTATNSYIYACRMKDQQIALSGMRKRVMNSLR